MIKRSISLMIALLFGLTLIAQDSIQWASEIIDATSEFSHLQYSAIQALHQPNVYPKGGDNPNAWRPLRPNKEEYIVVQFETPMKAQQIAISETENPGSIKKIWAYDINDNEYELFDLTPRAIPIKSRLLNLFFPETKYEIAYIRVDLDGKAVEGYFGIDAIGLSASNIPISVLIELVKNVNHDVRSEKLSKNVNSQYIEHSPLLSPDGKTLYFSRKFHPDNVGGVEDGEDIWYSELDSQTGQWQPAKNIGPPLNTSGPNFISSISQDGDETILLLGNQYDKSGRMRQGISTSRRRGNEPWSRPRNQEVDDDYNYSAKTDYYMSKDMNVILMSVERDESYGDRDIYVSFNKNGKWTAPKNLGHSVNGAAEDFAPFLADDMETLYFSSRSFRGYGGSDIYVSKRLDESWTNWSRPENMGTAINSEGDDVYFNIPSSGSMAYFTKGSVSENTDIYQFNVDEFFIDVEETDIVDPIITVSGKVLNAKTNDPIGTIIMIERLPDGAHIGQTVSNPKTGEYSFKLRPGARYGFFSEADGFLSVNQNLNLNELDNSGSVTQNLLLAPIEAGAAIAINNIFFDFDKSELKTASYPELSRILKLLKEEQIQKIEISGHTDAVGNDDYNLRLSRRRAKAVYDFFLTNDIVPDRLVSIGFGETKPVAPNDTKENQERNRRVEFKVLE